MSLVCHPARTSARRVRTPRYARPRASTNPSRPSGSGHSAKAPAAGVIATPFVVSSPVCGRYRPHARALVVRRRRENQRPGFSPGTQPHALIASCARRRRRRGDGDDAPFALDGKHLGARDLVVPAARRDEPPAAPATARTAIPFTPPGARRARVRAQGIASVPRRFRVILRALRPSPFLRRASHVPNRDRAVRRARRGDDGDAAVRDVHAGDGDGEDRSVVEPQIRERAPAPDTSAVSVRLRLRMKLRLECVRSRRSRASRAPRRAPSPSPRPRRRGERDRAPVDGREPRDVHVPLVGLHGRGDEPAPACPPVAAPASRAPPRGTCGRAADAGRRRTRPPPG